MTLIGKTKELDMIHGPILKNIILFSLPLMASMLLQMLFNAADTIVVGHFAGDKALAAVGNTGSVIFLLTALFFGLATGANVVIANAIGANDEQRVQKSVHTALSLSILCGILSIFIGMTLSKSILTLIDTPADILDDSILYMKLIFAGSIFILIYDFGASILRSKGDTKRPLYFLIISGILNVLLNLLFVIVFRMSVAGVAIATVISHAVSALLVIVSLMKDTGVCHLDLRKLCLDREAVIRIIKIGVPAGIQGAAFALSNVVILSSINSFNSSKIVAGNTAASNIENFVYIGMDSFSAAVMTFTSQNIGAKNYENIKKIMTKTLLIDVIFTFGLGLLAYLGADFFLGLYSDDPEVIAVGTIRLFYVAMFLFLNGILDVFVSSLRGMGYSTSPTVIMLLGVCLFRLLYLWFYFPGHQALDVIYAVFPVSWILTSIALMIQWIIVYRKVMSAASLKS